MSHLTSQQRKLVYLVGIVLLLGPIITLGRLPRRSEAAISGGGQLSSMRRQYELGETSLGDVDPSSSTMNLVLLGFRGIAVNQLWLQADKHKDHKNWGSLRAVVNSIIQLQPHFIEVWEHQGWNLAYNVSAAWDNVDDRFYWVKEGTKFTDEGAERNAKIPDLRSKVGEIISHKVGRADEWRQYRDFWVEDPDVDSYNGGPDTELNPEGKDSYLVARDHHLRANDLEDETPQHIMARPLFRSLPARQLLEYAAMHHKEGRFGDDAGRAWEDAFDEWTQEYGKTPFNYGIGEVWQEADEEDFLEMARLNDTSEIVVQQAVDRLQKMTNYRYWRERARAEGEQSTVDARREIYEGKQAFREGDTELAKERIISGLKKFRLMRDKFPAMADDPRTIEDILLAFRYLKAIYVDLDGESLPDDLPMIEVWNQYQDPSTMNDIEQMFRNEARY
ncbi:hypothetical protein [Stratiformator vulcanicus]|uniref:IRE (Iron responsive element) n=1 Tax=Stratiformator vulcanicus TaxID=2527980 RepID=A0A517QZF4_9PLAN|nr:hypothetical protein [Stratiformator vulcanicus]QDT37022.1 hypothetical protein Pan189_13880 [Stratiformator vulcanicus]